MSSPLCLFNSFFLSSRSYCCLAWTSQMLHIRIKTSSYMSTLLMFTWRSKLLPFLLVCFVFFAIEATLNWNRDETFKSYLPETQQLLFGCNICSLFYGNTNTTAHEDNRQMCGNVITDYRVYQVIVTMTYSGWVTVGNCCVCWINPVQICPVIQ